MLEGNIHNLIIRLFNGDASADEKAQVGNWINQSEENRKMYSDLQEIWLASGKLNEYDTKRAILQFQQRINKKQQKNFKIGEILKYAAIAVLLISLPFIYYLGKETSNAKETFTTITCAFGDKSNIILPDGSSVNLNSGSKLTFNNNFQTDYRNVELEGEAYFSVKKNKQIPFKVKTAGIEVEVLGTEFNLKAYPDENTVSTTLVEGSVLLTSNTQHTVMHPSQKVVYNKENEKMTSFQLNDIKPEIEWKEGRLVFRNESLEELELKLERWFDVDIEFADEVVKSRRFSGTLERESILEALSYFNYSDQIGYKIDNNEITFYSKLK